MRYVLTVFLSLVLAVPAYAAFEGPGAVPTVKDAVSVPQAAKDSASAPATLPAPETK